MKTLELKTSIHKIVDSIESEQLLKTIYDFLKLRETSNKIWDTLTEKEKSEVLLSYDESEDDNNLIEAKSIFGKSQ